MTVLSHDLHLQYVTNDAGQKISVILAIQEFEELMEDMQNLSVIAERQGEATIPHSQVLMELKSDGLL